eukprot:308848_1
MANADDVRKVLGAYESRFHGLPDQAQYLMRFSKSRSDLPTLNYVAARRIINDLKNKTKSHTHQPKSRSMPALALANLASVIPLPHSPDRRHPSIICEDEEEGVEQIHKEGDDYEESDDDDDNELYCDGHETTAPFTQMIANGSLQHQDEQNINHENKYHPNHHAMETSGDPSNPTIKDWCFNNGLQGIYDKLISAGYTTCKMLSKCRDEHIDKISRELQLTTPQELMFKVAVDELRMLYLDRQFHLRHPEEHRSLTDIASKIHESEKLMATFYDKLQNMNTELYAYQMDIEREINTMIQQLNKRKLILMNELNKFFIKKKNIIDMKQRTLNQFITETKVKKNEIICMLHDGDVDIHRMEDRKKRIMNMHDDIIVQYLNVKKAQYAGCPTIHTSFLTTPQMLKQVVQFGKVEQNTKNTLGVMPVITSINYSGKDTKIKIKWELTNDHYGIDPETVQSIRIEWIEVDDDAMQSEIEDCMLEVFGTLDDAKNDFEEDEKKEIDTESPSQKVTLNRWMSKHIRFSLYKAVKHEHDIDVRVYGKFLVRVKLLGAEHALTTHYVTSNVFSIKVQKKGIYYRRDKWDPRSKHSDLRIGLVNKKTITRNVPGKWKNCMGSTVVRNGVNIWRLLLKKRDTNRKGFSCMIGIMDVTKPCYMNVNFTEIGGYGMYMNNGNIFHNKKKGKTYYDTTKKGFRPIRNGDVISVILDYYQGTLSFKINEYDCGTAWRNISTCVAYKLCISMRGCDEVKLLDTDQNMNHKIKRKHVFKKKNNKENLDLNIDLLEVENDKSCTGVGGSKTPDVKPKMKYAISAKHIRQKSANLLGKIRRHSANSGQIARHIKGLRNGNVEKNKMKTNKSRHKHSLSFFKFSKRDKEIEKLQHNLKTLKDESDDAQFLNLDINQIIANYDKMSTNPMYNMNIQKKTH